MEKATQQVKIWITRFTPWADLSFARAQQWSIVTHVAPGSWRTCLAMTFIRALVKVTDDCYWMRDIGSALLNSQWKRHLPKCFEFCKLINICKVPFQLFDSVLKDICQTIFLVKFVAWRIHFWEFSANFNRCVTLIQRQIGQSTRNSPRLVHVDQTWFVTVTDFLNFLFRCC